VGIPSDRLAATSNTSVDALVGSENPAGTANDISTESGPESVEFAVRHIEAVEDREYFVNGLQGGTGQSASLPLQRSRFRNPAIETSHPNTVALPFASSMHWRSQVTGRRTHTRNLDGIISLTPIFPIY